MKIKNLYRIAISSIVLLIIIFNYTYIRDTIKLEKEKLNYLSNNNLQVLSITLDREIENAKMSLDHIHRQFTIFKTSPPESRMSRDQLSELMAQNIASHPNQYNTYFALEPELSQKLYKQEAISNDVHKDLAQMGTDEYGKADNRIVEYYDDPGYQSSQDEIWYHIGKKSQDFQVTDIYFDQTYMKQWMFSVILGLYEGGEFQGVIGVDILLDSYFSQIENNTLNKTGGLFLLNRYDNTIVTSIDSRNLHAPFDATVRGKTKISSSREWLDAIDSESLNTIVQNSDGDKLLVKVIPLKNLPWKLVSYQDLPTLYMNIRRKIALIIIGSILIMLITITGFNILFKTINDLVEDLEYSKNEAEKAKNLAEQSNAAKSIFLANMSHEIRTPLNAIMGFSELLQAMPLHDKAMSYIKNISISSKSLTKLINDILDLSKIEADKLELYYSSFSLPNLIHEVHELFTYRVKKKHLDFQVIFDDKLPKFVNLDEARLRQVLINLVGNAIKFTQTGFVKLTVRHEMMPGVGNYCKLYFDIEDSGEGIAPSEQEKIFNAFQQAQSSNSRHHPGTGLGLSISLRLIKMMNGSINVQSELNRGSTFSICLNRVQVPLEAKSEIKMHTNKLKISSCTIVVADDIAINRELIKSFLANETTKILEAKNGHEVLDCCDKEKIDIILLDMVMPEMDGYEAAAILKENEKTKDIPIIAVTASALKEDERKLRKICDGYLAKPFTGDSLMTEIHKSLSPSS
ncbi:ATP-binding protein [Lentisphaera profundi]|uniref:histidine kinase n=1 Tax=Lentisphaera profundi TaxID=1658616 RepID=A0ABY7VNV6_9BACT|nr:hybrid sensor histidine kinase/response regulator [Lentisphaera profundi]WDE95826.1 ATP-binding protein [Lentisphaera profundi]